MVSKLRVKFDEISSTYNDTADAMDTKGKEKQVSNDYRQFVNWARRGTTDTGSRVGRANFVCARLKSLEN